MPITAAIDSFEARQIDLNSLFIPQPQYVKRESAVEQMDRVLRQHAGRPPQMQNFQPNLARSDVAEPLDPVAQLRRDVAPEVFTRQLSFAPTVYPNIRPE